MTTSPPTTATLALHLQQLQEILQSIDPLIETINTQIANLDATYDSLGPADATDEARKRTLQERIREDESYNMNITLAYTAVFSGKAAIEIRARTEKIEAAYFDVCHAAWDLKQDTEEAADAEQAVEQAKSQVQSVVEKYIDVQSNILTRKLNWLRLGRDTHIPVEYMYPNFKYHSDITWVWYETAFDFEREIQEGTKLVGVFYPLLDADERREKCRKLIVAASWFAERLLWGTIMPLRDFMALERLKGMKEDRMKELDNDMKEVLGEDIERDSGEDSEDEREESEQERKGRKQEEARSAEAAKMSELALTVTMFGYEVDRYKSNLEKLRAKVVEVLVDEVLQRDLLAW